MWLFSLDKEYSGFSSKRVLRHIVWWTFWISFYTLVNGSYHDRYGGFMLLELFIMTVKIPYAYGIVYYFLPKYLPTKRYTPLIMWIVVLAILGIYLIIQLNKLVYPIIPEVINTQPTTFLSFKSLIRALDLVYGVSLIIIIKMLQQFARQTRINTQLKEEKVNAELQNLKNQLQPHFLFNTLNNIYGKVLHGDKSASDAILRLSSIMSYMLYECNESLIDLDKELMLIKDYIELEKLRYGDRLDVSLEIAGNPKGKMITPLLLIPFVENAFKHGVSNSEKKSWIRINLQIEQDTLLFMIENSVPSQAETTITTKSGIGLPNVQKRLELLYPQRHQLHTTGEEDTFLVNLRIDL